MFQSFRKGISFSFELNPAMLELAFSTIVDCLPIVVDDEVCDIDVVLC